jgi:hypothetical protein
MEEAGETVPWIVEVILGTTPARYLYLTEQESNFSLWLESSGLLECGRYISVIQFKDVSSCSSPTTTTC